MQSRAATWQRLRGNHFVTTAQYLDLFGREMPTALVETEDFLGTELRGAWLTPDSSRISIAPTAAELEAVGLGKGDVGAAETVGAEAAAPETLNPMFHGDRVLPGSASNMRAGRGRTLNASGRTVVLDSDGMDWNQTSSSEDDSATRNRYGGGYRAAAAEAAAPETLGADGRTYKMRKCHITDLGLQAEGLRHIALKIKLGLGSLTHHCHQCQCALMAMCKVLHSWYDTKFDPNFVHRDPRNPSGQS